MALLQWIKQKVWPTIMTQANSDRQAVCKWQISPFILLFCSRENKPQMSPIDSTSLNYMRLNNQQKQYLHDIMVNSGIVTSSAISFSCSNCLSFWKRKCWISSSLHSDCSSCVSISSWISSELRERSTTRTWAKMDGWISIEQKQEYLVNRSV